MEDKPNNVFERLDSIEAQQSFTQEQNAQIIKLLNNLNKRQSSANGSSNINSGNQKLGEVELWKNFIMKSKREHVWFGTQEEFDKSKTYVLLICIGIIVFGIISTILTGLATGLYYCPFSIVENIWVIFIFVILCKTIGLQKRMLDLALAEHATSIYLQDSDGVWRDTRQEKKRYKIFRRLAYVAVGLNIIMIWGLTKGTINTGISIAATIFEIAFLGLSIGYIFVYGNLDCMYGNFIIFTGKNPVAQGPLTVVFDVMANTTDLYDEYKEKYNDMI